MPSYKNFYNENGYIFIKNLFPKKMCLEAKKKILSCCDENFSQMLNIHKENFLISHNVKKLNKIKNLAIRSDEIKRLSEISKNFLNLARYKKFVNILNNLYKKEVVGTQSQVVVKKPKTKFSKQSYLPHQDNSYAKNKNGLFFTTHLFLEKSSINNGTLYLYPKSHKLGLLKSKQGKSFDNNKKAGNKVIFKSLDNKYKKIFIDAEPGDLLIVHGNCIHGSVENKSKNKSRIVYTLCCIPINEKFISGKNARREIFKLIVK